MSTATKTAATSKTPYKQLLIRAKNLQATAKANVYARVKLLVRVYQDEQFRLEHGANDFALADALDQYVDDTGWGFLELKTILEYFPKDQDWRNNRLTKLHADVMQEKRRQRRAAKDRQDTPAPKKPTKADVKKLEQDRRHWEAKYREAAARADQRQSEAAVPTPKEAEQVETLRAQLNAAKARIVELERENETLRSRCNLLQRRLEEAAMALA